MPGAAPSDNTETPARQIVLIAEDEEPIAEALAMIVEDAGYKPLIAPHGLEALNMARAYHPALLITDLMMPHLDGEKLIQALEEDARQEGRSRIPVILTTAVGGTRLADVKGDALLRKPFNVEDLEILLRRFLEESDQGSPPSQ